MAEHLALEERRRDAAEVHLDEGPARARLLRWRASATQLLAGAALAGDQHRGVGGADPADDVETRRSRGSLPDERAEVVPRVELLARRAGSGRRAAPSARPRAVATDCRSWAFVQGFVTKSAAPAFIPWTASSIEPHAVMRTTGRLGPRRLDLAGGGEPLLAGRLAGEVHVLEDEVDASVQPRERLVRATPRRTRSRPASGAGRATP